jgi:hypothetical protein
MKIRPVGAELLHTERKTDRHDETDSLFSQILRTCLKMASNSWLESTEIFPQTDRFTIVNHGQGVSNNNTNKYI